MVVLAGGGWVAPPRLDAAGVNTGGPQPPEGEGLTGPPQEIVSGDARQALSEFEAESFDFVVTSPPYWRILTKKAGEKTKAERRSKGLPTKYSKSPDDLGNIEDYDDFLAELGKVFAGCARVLRAGKYMCVIVSDFRHGPRFYLYHADLAQVIEEIGLALKGITVLVQDSKNLYPLGIPYAFVSNIHHQYVLVFQRTADFRPPTPD